MAKQSTVTMLETQDWRQGKLVRIGSTERVKNLNQQFHETRPNICLHGMRIYTKVYKETEGESEVLRRGKAIAEVLSAMPPVIMPLELIVGQPGCRLKGTSIKPAMLGWLQAPDEFEELDTRDYDPWKVTPEQKKELKEKILPYWKDKTVREICTKKAMDLMPDEWGILIDTGVANITNYLHSIGSHINPPYDDIVAKGFKWYEGRAKEKLAQLGKNEFEKEFFYEAILKTIGGIKQWSENYRNHALDLAAKEKDRARASELKKIAEIVGRVPYEPARTLHEALQSMFFTQCFLWLEGSGCGFGLGRMDRFLYPYYQKDIESGALTKAQALELIECMWIKMTGIHWLLSKMIAWSTPGYYPFQQVHVGGIDKNLKYYANDLSYMFIEALLNVRTTQPTLCIMWHRDMPWELKVKTGELIAAGMGHPSIFNYEKLIEMRMNDDPAERWDELIWDVKPIGCVEPQGAGCKQFGHTAGGAINAGSMVELVFTRGLKRTGLLHIGEKVGLDTGPLQDLKSFEDFKGAVKKQMEYLVDLTMRGLWIAEKTIADKSELLIQSIFTDDCIEKGMGCANGGARYPVGPHVQIIGIADLANSLASVKKCVYDSKMVSLEELAKALEADFAGYEEVHKKLLKAPKYGNDDDYVDDLAREVFMHFAKTVRKYRNLRGGTPGPCAVPTSCNVPFGIEVGALPAPKGSMRPLADGISPQQGTDMLGPTASLRSVAKLPIAALTGGTITNIWLSGDSLLTEEGLHKWANLVDTYVYEGGYHLQMNTISKKTLLDAQIHPEKYPTLMVRVAGYSAYFVDLAKMTQDDIISRTEHKL